VQLYKFTTTLMTLTRCAFCFQITDLLCSNSKLASVPEEPSSLSNLDSGILFRGDSNRTMDLNQSSALVPQQQTLSDSYADLSLQYSSKIFSDTNSYGTARSQQPQQMAPPPDPQPFYFTAQDSIIVQSQMQAQGQSSISLAPQLSSLLQEQNQSVRELSPQHQNASGGSKSSSASKGSNHGSFAMPNINKVCA